MSDLDRGTLLHVAGAGSFSYAQDFLAASTRYLAPAWAVHPGHYFQCYDPVYLDAWCTEKVK